MSDEYCCNYNLDCQTGCCVAPNMCVVTILPCDEDLSNKLGVDYDPTKDYSASQEKEQGQVVTDDNETKKFLSGVELTLGVGVGLAYTLAF